MPGIEAVEEASVAQLRGAMEAGTLSAQALVARYRERIEALDRQGPALRAVLELNPEADAIARTLDVERAQGKVRGPLHGIPVLLKDNIDTADGMHTTAGSLALMESRPARDATVVRRLRKAGVVILGKTNLSEWANFRSTRSSSGWSARGGQGRNPYVLDRSPCGSSSGSAVAVAAGMAAVAVATETDGSILCPAALSGIVGIKPTVGLVSCAGVIPIAHSQDVVGPMARTVADAAALLGLMTGEDDQDAATQGSQSLRSYMQCLDKDALHGARIGIAREVYFGYHEQVDLVAEAAIAVLKDLGAEVIDPANIPTAEEMRKPPSEMVVLLHEFKAGLNQYLDRRGDPLVHTLGDLIRFNETHAAEEMPFFRQELLVQAQAKGPLTDSAYLEALRENHSLSRERGINLVMDAQRLDALFMPTRSPAWTIDLVNGDRAVGGSQRPTALAGYPAITVPAGYAFGALPVGVTFMGRAWSEPKLIAYAYALEQALGARRPPQFLPTL
jgi:amidase